MFEIELKAHVDNYEKTKTIIESFAHFLGEKNKSDVYWHQPSQNPVQIRVREESAVNSFGKKPKVLTVTYKKKEVRNSANNIAYEVNDEKEFTIDNRSSFETFLHDAGFRVVSKKEKHVLQWQYDGVLLELCTITGLGNFLELEITSEVQSKTVEKDSLKKLHATLALSGIELEKIEKRYYNDLLREKNL